MSIIVLCYNQSRFVWETLESVRAQTYQATQLIILDDCSSDSSVAIIEGWIQENGIDCTFIRHDQNKGICKSLNEGLTIAAGQYISTLASDDILLPDKIERQVKIMEAQPNSVGLVYSDAFMIDEQGNPLPEMFIARHRKLSEIPQGDVLGVLLGGNFIPGMTALIRRSCYDEVGVYDESLRWEDWDMWMRIARRYRFLYSPIPSAKYRYHLQSLSHSNLGRLSRDSFEICLKQFRLGQLNKNQRSTLLQTLFAVSEDLYRREDPDCHELLRAMAETTYSTRAMGMYLFAKLGISFRHWQRAENGRQRMRRVAGRFFNLHS